MDAVRSFHLLSTKPFKRAGRSLWKRGDHLLEEDLGLGVSTRSGGALPDSLGYRNVAWCRPKHGVHQSVM